MSDFDIQKWAEGFEQHMLQSLAHRDEARRQTDQEVRTLATTVNELTGTVSALASKVDAISKNQSGMFERMNRPWQWSVVVAIMIGMITMMGAFATILNLTVKPIENNMAQNHEYQRRFRDSVDADLQQIIDHQTNQASSIAVLEEAGRWHVRSLDNHRDELRWLRDEFQTHEEETCPLQ